MHGGVFSIHKIAMQFCDKVSCNNSNVTITCNRDIYKEMAVVHQMYVHCSYQSEETLGASNHWTEFSTGLWDWTIQLECVDWNVKCHLVPVFIITCSMHITTR